MSDNNFLFYFLENIILTQYINKNLKFESGERIINLKRIALKTKNIKRKTKVVFL